MCNIVCIVHAMVILHTPLICQVPVRSESPDPDATYRQTSADVNAAHKSLEEAISKNQTQFSQEGAGPGASFKWQVGLHSDCHLTAISMNVSSTAMNVCLCVHTGAVGLAA